MALRIHRREEPARRNRQGLVEAGQIETRGARVTERVDRAGRDSEERRRARLINIICSHPSAEGCRRVHEARNRTRTEGDDAAVAGIATWGEVSGPVGATDGGPTANDAASDRRGARDDDARGGSRRGDETTLHVAGGDIRGKRGTEGARAGRREVQRAARILGERSHREGRRTRRSGVVIKGDVEGARTCADGNRANGLGIVLDDGRLEGELTAVQRDGNRADTGGVTEHPTVVENERAGGAVQVNRRSRGERRLVGQGDGTADVRHAREAQGVGEGLRARTDA